MVPKVAHPNEDQYKNKLSSYVFADIITAKQPRGDDTSACWKGPRLLTRTQANTQKTNGQVLFLSYRSLEPLHGCEFPLLRIWDGFRADELSLVASGHGTVRGGEAKLLVKTRSPVHRGPLC